ncbi:hypothetical protein N656DRAFT_790265 [Canariomyces notabilis]|uniref:HNH domain-containing protein n=1 Tax=Canariomyces notabilis TaxID=2074819 RepID=A0AAN6TC23_9PEZI|nr:hypothetical protein N656DRAFT_790265 [Canariomyces arenarius]
MGDDIPEELSSNYEQFRDILSSVLIEKITTPTNKPKPKRRSKKSTINASPPTPPSTSPQADAADDLADFISYIATTTFLSLPLDLQSLTYTTWTDTPSLQSLYSPLPLPNSTVSAILQCLDPSVPDSLAAYGITSPPSSLQGLTTTEFFAPILSGYIGALTTPPPPPSSTRGKVSACEICGRDWINLTYHHLIPRMVHDKVVKRGWHRPEDLQNVAWLCGACHRFVHRFAGHEVLAREYYTVERLLQAEEVQRFAEWVGRLRWKGR